MNDSNKPSTEPKTEPGDEFDTCVYYLYRDAANYKLQDSVTLAGTGDARRCQELWDGLPADAVGNRRFVPEQVGLPSLRELMPGDYPDDTNWHELTGLQHVVRRRNLRTPDSRPGTSPGTFGEFVDRCLAVQRSPRGWDPDPRIPHGTTVFPADYWPALHHPAAATK